MPDYYKQAIANAERICGETTASNPHQIIGSLGATVARHMKFAERIANLNPDCAEIGAGMLAQLVAEARLLMPDETRN